MQTLLAGALLPHLPLQLPQPPRPVWQEKELLPAEAQGAAENKFVPALSFDLALMLGNIPVTCAYSLFFQGDQRQWASCQRQCPNRYPWVNNLNGD